MNYFKPTFHPSTTTDDAVRSSSLNSCVRFNDLTATPQPLNDREKYLTA
jgi:hypothetical protein